MPWRGWRRGRHARRRSRPAHRALASSAPISSAWTRPRWRSGKARSARRGKRARDRQAGRRDALLDKGAVAFARDAIDDDAANRHIRTEGGEALGERAGRLRLAGDIEHQKDGPAGSRGDAGGGAVIGGARRRLRRRRGPSEPRRGRDRTLPAASTRPSSRRGASPSHRGCARASRRDGMEGRIDIVRAAFHRLDDKAGARAKRAEGQGSASSCLRRSGARQPSDRGPLRASRACGTFLPLLGAAARRKRFQGRDRAS